MVILPKIIADLFFQNAFEDLHNLMLGADIDTWSTIADGTFIGRAAVAGFSSAQWADLIAGSSVTLP